MRPAKIVTMTLREARQVVKTYDLMRTWIQNHEELCTERLELQALDNSIRAGGRVIDRLERQAS